jgi:hypothetical protein
MLDSAARDYLGMTGDEFLRAYEAGALGGCDHMWVEQVAALIPFACASPRLTDDAVTPAR